MFSDLLLMSLLEAVMLNLVVILQLLRICNKLLLQHLPMLFQSVHLLLQARSLASLNPQTPGGQIMLSISLVKPAGQLSQRNGALECLLQGGSLRSQLCTSTTCQSAETKFKKHWENSSRSLSDNHI
jgi:hypothetical protein